MGLVFAVLSLCLEKNCLVVVVKQNQNHKLFKSIKKRATYVTTCKHAVYVCIYRFIIMHATDIIHVHVSYSCINSTCMFHKHPLGRC